MSLALSRPGTSNPKRVSIQMLEPGALSQGGSTITSYNTTLQSANTTGSAVLWSEETVPQEMLARPQTSNPRYIDLVQRESPRREASPLSANGTPTPPKDTGVLWASESACIDPNIVARPITSNPWLQRIFDSEPIETQEKAPSALPLRTSQILWSHDGVDWRMLARPHTSNPGLEKARETTGPGESGTNCEVIWAREDTVQELNGVIKGQSERIAHLEEMVAVLQQQLTNFTSHGQTIDTMLARNTVVVPNQPMTPTDVGPAPTQGTRIARLRGEGEERPATAVPQARTAVDIPHSGSKADIAARRAQRSSVHDAADGISQAETIPITDVDVLDLKNAPPALSSGGSSAAPSPIPVAGSSISLNKMPQREMVASTTRYTSCSDAQHGNNAPATGNSAYKEIIEAHAISAVPPAYTSKRLILSGRPEAKQAFGTRPPATNNYVGPSSAGTTSQDADLNIREDVDISPLSEEEKRRVADGHYRHTMRYRDYIQASGAKLPMRPESALPARRDARVARLRNEVNQQRPTTAPSQRYIISEAQADIHNYSAGATVFRGPSSANHTPSRASRYGTGYGQRSPVENSPFNTINKASTGFKGTANLRVTQTDFIANEYGRLKRPNEPAVLKSDFKEMYCQKASEFGIEATERQVDRYMEGFDRAGAEYLSEDEFAILFLRVASW